MTAPISVDSLSSMDDMQVQHVPPLPQHALPGRAPALTSARGTAALAVREAVLLGLLMAVYQASRLLGGRDVAGAFENAREVLHVERWLRLPSEQALQAALLGAEPLVRAANGYYAAAHLPVTGAVLLWLLVTKRALYRRTRNALIAGTGAALAVYLLLPVAPPRMLPGFVDTAALHGQSVYGDPTSSALTNQYAALPSLHVGWAVLIALACVAASRTRWRWLWLAHPVLTVAVVVVTANHFWLDAVAGAALLVLAWHAAALSRQRRTAPDAGTRPGPVLALVPQQRPAPAATCRS